MIWVLFASLLGVLFVWSRGGLSLFLSRALQPVENITKGAQRGSGEFTIAACKLKNKSVRYPKFHPAEVLKEDGQDGREQKN
jgi:hypothetical protein